MRELTLPGRLILLPGLGSTSAVFQHQRKAFGDRLETPDFIPHHQGESVAAYAQRWAKQLSRPGDDHPLFIGGTSFGGMIAQEMAGHLDPKPRAVLLIASARTGDRIAPTMQLVELFARCVPTASIPRLLPLGNLAMALRDGLDDDDKQAMLQSARDCDPAFIKWAGSAAVGWSGYHARPDDPPTHQIHARRDWVIRPPVDASNVQWVDGSSHLLHMTHRSTVNRFLFDRMIDHCPEAQVRFPPIEDPDATAQRRAILEGAPAGTPLV